MRVRAALACWVSVGVGLCAAPAAAQRCAPVSVRACDRWLDGEALTRALVTEGVRCDVELRCEDGRLHMDPGPDAGWDLTTIPRPVRARIVALLISERVRDPGAIPPLPPPPATESGVAPASPTTGGAGSRLIEASESPSPNDQVSSGDSARPDGNAGPASSAAAESGTLGVALDSPMPSRRAHPGGLFVAHQVTLAEGTGPRFGVGGHVFVFLDPATTMAGPSLGFAFDAVRIEGGWTFGQAIHPLGSVDTMLGHVSAGLSLVCIRWSDISACASAFATLGYARADPSANEEVTEQAAEGVYGGGALELGAWMATEVVAVSLGLRGGWGYGLLVAASDDEIASIGGPWIGAVLGLELEPVR